MASKKTSRLAPLLEMLKEAGVYSVNRVVPVSLIYSSFTLFMGVTLYLILKGDAPFSWGSYSDLCTVLVAIVVACGSWLTGNKITNSKYNTLPGEAGKPLTKAQQNMINMTGDLIETLEEKTKAKETKGGE